MFLQQNSVDVLVRAIAFQQCDPVSILAPVVQTLDSTIHWINHYPLDNSIGFASVYPLDSDLSGGQRYPSFEQLGLNNNTTTWQDSTTFLSMFVSC